MPDLNEQTNSGDMFESLQEREVGGLGLKFSPRAIDIARRIKAARNAQGRTILECAMAIGITEQQFRYLESQVSEKAEQRYLVQIANMLGTDSTWLATGIGSEPNGTMVEGPQHRQVLAARAVTRREALQLSCLALAQEIGVPYANFRQWEQKLPLLRQAAEEQKWEQALKVPEGWLRNQAMQANSPKSVWPQQVTEAANVGEELHRLVVWVARKNPSRRTEKEINLTALERRTVDIMMQRYGSQDEASTLQAIAERHDLTRERVRQIIEGVMDRLPVDGLQTPCLDALEAELRVLLPAKVAELDARFAEQLGIGWSLVGVDRFSRELLGRRIARITERPANLQIPWEPVALPLQGFDPNVTRVARDAALAMIRSVGAAHWLYVVGATAHKLRRGLLPDEVLSSLKVVPSFEWLAEPDGWFWLGPEPENRMRTAALKILAIANRNVDAEEILQGAARARRGYYEPDRARPVQIEAPIAIVKQVLQRLPELECIQHNDFRVRQRSSELLQEVLSDAEQHVYAVLTRHGGIAARHTLLTELVESDKLKFMALQMMLASSPIIVQLDFGLYGLRGVRYASDHLAEQADAVGGTSRSYALLSGVAQDDGWLRMQINLSEHAVRTSQFFVPVALASRMTEGNYQIDGVAKPATLVKLPDKGHRLGRFVSAARQKGIREGESFVLAVHPGLRQIRIEPAEAQAERIMALPFKPS